MPLTLMIGSLSTVAQGVPGAARAPADERHRNHHQQHGQADEDQGGDERGPGLAGHGGAPASAGRPTAACRPLAGDEVLLLPDRHLGLEGVDQLRAGGQRVAAVDRADGHHDGEVPDLEVADPVLDRDRDHVAARRPSARRSARAPPRRSGAGCSRGRPRRHPGRGRGPRRRTGRRRRRRDRSTRPSSRSTLSGASMMRAARTGDAMARTIAAADPRAFAPSAISEALAGTARPAPAAYG